MMTYRDQIEESARKRAKAGMDALELLTEIAAVEVGEKQIPRVVGLMGKVAASLGGLEGMVNSMAWQFYPERVREEEEQIVYIEGSTFEFLDALANEVSTFYRIDLVNLIGPRKTKDLVRARHVFFYLARLSGKATLKEIGGYCGGRDHSTVISGADSIDAALSIEPDLPTTIQAIRNRINNPEP